MWSTYATKRPVNYTELHKRQPFKAAILHTNGGGSDNGSLYGWWEQQAQAGQHIGAQFQVGYKVCEQYVDTDLVVYHAYSASEWAVGIETEDDGNPQTPWNDFQIAHIVAILHELGVPPVLLGDKPGDGIGYHQQYADWNKDGHVCPGDVRAQQITTQIIPQLKAAYATGGSDDMTPDESKLLTDTANRVANLERWLATPGTGDNSRIAQIEADVAAIKKKLGA